MERPELSFDGRGINGPDIYRSRLATFQNDEAARQYGKLFERAPLLLAFVEQMARFRMYQPGCTDDYQDAMDTLNEMIRSARLLCPNVVPSEVDDNAE